MKKLMVFPFDIDSTPICRYKDMLNNYELIGVISFENKIKGNQYEFGILDGSMETGFCISDDFESIVEKCDTVLFLNSNKLNIDNYKKYIDMSNSLSKGIVLENELVYELEKQGIAINFNHQLLSSKKDNEFEELIFDGLQTIDIPVIFVYGLGQYCNKFDLQLSLRKHFVSREYHVLQYGSKSISELFGFQELPQFMFDNSLSIKDKVIKFNHFIKNEVEKSIPDILIIGIPGGIIPYDKYFHNDFAEIAYIISSALKADISILSVYPFEAINEDYLNSFIGYCKYKFGSTIEYFNLANTTYSISKDDSPPELNFINLPIQLVQKIQNENFKNTELNVFNIFDDSICKILNKIENELTSNIQII